MFKFYKLACCVIVFVSGGLFATARPGVNHLDESIMHPKHRHTRAIFGLEQELTSDFWHVSAQRTMREKLKKKENTNIAKNIVLFMGDGMSIPTLAATRAYVGQKNGQSGEESVLSFEDFPYTGLSKTYCVDHQVADSACASTAYLCGVKGNSGTLGVNARVPFRNCPAMRNESHHVDSILAWAQRVGKSTGVVTTTRITHASPAGSYAHTADRDWESDKDVIKSKLDPTSCRDIGWQLVNQAPGNRLNVIFGGGRKKLLPEDFMDEEGQHGERQDGANLINKWLEDKEREGVNARYIWDKHELQNLNIEETDYVLGIFEDDHLQYNLEMDPSKEPSIIDMTESAIKVLSKNPNGFVLFIEGGRIDHAHHDSLAKKALDETEQMANAVTAALDLTSSEDTLIVVTSDHAHTMSMSGYAERGHDVLGIATISNEDELPYPILSYANGPGYKHPSQNGSRYDITADDMHNNNYTFPSMVPLDSETHGADDVAVFCIGPWSHLCTGLYEQNVIPHIIGFSSCIGKGLTACDFKG